jgi:hypothetical protein
MTKRTMIDADYNEVKHITAVSCSFRQLFSTSYCHLGEEGMNNC